MGAPCDLGACRSKITNLVEPKLPASHEANAETYDGYTMDNWRLRNCDCCHHCRTDCRLALIQIRDRECSGIRTVGGEGAGSRRRFFGIDRAPASLVRVFARGIERPLNVTVDRL